MRTPRESAIGLVRAWLAYERTLALDTHRWAPEVLVSGTEEHPPGWLVFCQSAEYLRTRHRRHRLSGLGPFLVDAADGSLHLIPAPTYLTGAWEDLYRHDVRGLPRPDPVARLVGARLEDRGTVAALRELRRHAPGMSIAQAREYVAAVARHEPPRAELADLTRPPEVVRPPLPIITVRRLPETAPPLLTGGDRARQLGYYRELAGGEQQAPSMLPFLYADPGEDDKALLGYLRAGTLLAATTSLASCHLEPGGPPLGSTAVLTDGTWDWPSDLAHYVEQHHLRLPPAFVHHARSNGWVPPSQADPGRCGAAAPDAPESEVPGL
ncbi:YrhB domain-containing protein [Kitasatospora sp. NPDC094015]|uniref:YrhB domain-containing protein n=1 Tax=Kitasatospora sp. NPDC094015 TaxID=3155205 RepID=UPI0033302E22